MLDEAAAKLVEVYEELEVYVTLFDTD